MHASNATQAAKRAGYRDLAIQVQGSRLLSKVMVAEAIATRQAAIAPQAWCHPTTHCDRAGQDAFADIRKSVQWGRSPIDTEPENAKPNGVGNPVELVPSEMIDDDTAGAVSEAQLAQTGIPIKMHDKKSALVCAVSKGHPPLDLW
ncbi:terminase small subunit [Mesorhizobium neociceri]|uniref:terminase small subunit n=1 Tax=Mesorhizobium neociceri TaxID=1307853 RepID=UPI002E2B6A7F|nr:terminase small subunit [Mesorhizobium neociceri]